MFYNKVINGIDNNNNQILNAHISYKGRSVIIDYEHFLHAYTVIPENTVPVEMYPYGEDIFVGYCPIDERFRKADITKLVELLDEALQKEE